MSEAAGGRERREAGLLFRSDIRHFCADHKAEQAQYERKIGGCADCKELFDDPIRFLFDTAVGDRHQKQQNDKQNGTCRKARHRDRFGAEKRINRYDRTGHRRNQQQIDHDGKRCHAAAAGILKITEKFPELSKRLADLEKRRAVADGIEEKVDSITEPFSE